MKTRFLIIATLLCTVIQAQSYYEAARFDEYRWNEVSKEYEDRGGSWEDTRFILHKEYFTLEKDLQKETFYKWWWVYYGDNEQLGECHILENDAAKVCIDEDNQTLWILTGYDEEISRWTKAGALSRIKKIKPFLIHYYE